jgi:hypothetical protein
MRSGGDAPLRVLGGDLCQLDHAAGGQDPDPVGFQRKNRG